MQKIEREILIKAPAERVWTLLTEAEHLARWFTFEDAKVDLRPGGQMSFTWKEHGTHLARIERVEPPRFLSYRWALVEDQEPRAGNSTLVEFTVEAQDDGALVRVVETGFGELDGSAEDRLKQVQDNVQGWTGGLDNLKEYAER